jgi:hypothetical protein
MADKGYNPVSRSFIMNRRFGLLVAAAAWGVTVPASAWAQQRGDPDHEWCEDVRRGDRDRERYCEVREFTLDARSLIAVDAGPNGGITVEGWNGSNIRVLARVQTWSQRGDPEDFLGDIEVITTGREIRSEGPRGRDIGRNNGWSVSYELMVPFESDLSLESTNGGISITDVKGKMDFRTTNGGIDLAGLAGDVSGRTTNGSIRVDLEGAEWDGTGLDVQTTNGTVTLDVPEGFQADLEIGTTNGGFRIDFPITLQGRINRRRIRTELNGGGALIKAITTNGGVTVRRR